MTNENVHEEDRMTVKTQLLMVYAKVNHCIMRIRLWRIERQRNFNDFLSCKSGYQNVNWLLLSIIIVMAAFIGERECNTLPVPS